MEEESQFSLPLSSLKAVNFYGKKKLICCDIVMTVFRHKSYVSWQVSSEVTTATLRMILSALLHKKSRLYR